MIFWHNVLPPSSFRVFVMFHVLERIAAVRGLLLLFLLLLSHTPIAVAGEIQIAVASNFTRPMTEVAALFEKTSGHQAKLSFGSSGKFVAQIRHGAPFDVFLSADQEKPARLLEMGLAVSGSEFTYAEGRLALWSGQPGYVDAKGEVLQRADYRYLAVANAQLAPYGRAAQEVLTALELSEVLRNRAVFGENIAQTFQFVKTGNAELGFIALSQIIEQGEIGEGSAWVIPADYHTPIKQDAVLLNVGADNAAARAFLAFLRHEAAQSIIRHYGYEIPVYLHAKRR